MHCVRFVLCAMTIQLCSATVFHESKTTMNMKMVHSIRQCTPEFDVSFFCFFFFEFSVCFQNIFEHLNTFQLFLEITNSTVLFIFFLSFYFFNNTMFLFLLSNHFIFFFESNFLFQIYFFLSKTWLFLH